MMSVLKLYKRACLTLVIVLGCSLGSVSSALAQLAETVLNAASYINPAVDAVGTAVTLYDEAETTARNLDSSKTTEQALTEHLTQKATQGQSSSLSDGKTLSTTGALINTIAMTDSATRSSMIISSGASLATNIATSSATKEYYEKNNIRPSEVDPEVLKILDTKSGGGSGWARSATDALKKLAEFTGVEGSNEFGSNLMGANYYYNQVVTEVNKLANTEIITEEQRQKVLAHALELYSTGKNNAEQAAAYSGNLARVYRINLNSSCNITCAPKCFYKELQTCSFCPLFAVVFNTASSIAQHAINTFSESIVRVVIIAFGIWIAFQILAFVATVEVRDFKDLASSLITQSFIVMLVVIILQNGAMDFFNYALEPVYTTGQKLAQTIIQPNDVAKGNVTLAALEKEKQVPNNVLKACTTKTGINNDKEGKGALPKSMGDSIICTMTLIQNRVAQVKALGSASLCKSWQERFFIIPHLNYMLIGIGLWIGSMVLLLAVPFMMVDAIFEMAVAAALLPFGIGAYAFKVTRGYTKKIWETFLNSMFQFVFVSLISLMLVVAYQSIITNSTGSIDYMFEDEQGTVLSDLLMRMPWFSTAFLELCFVMILAWSVLGAAKDFAGEFAGSISNTSIGSSIGTMAGSFTKSAALKIAKPTAEAAAEHIGHGIKAAAVAPVHYARRAAMNHRAARIKKNGQYDAKTGQYVLTSKHWWGDKKLTLVENADGTKTVNKEKTRFTRNILGQKTGTVVKTKVQNTHFTVTVTEHQKDGKVWYEDKVSLNSSFASELYRKDGSLNGNDLENLMISQGVANADKINIALAKEAMAQRMPNAKHNFRNHGYVSQEALYEDGKFVGYIETHDDGSKSVVRFNIGAADKKGHKRMMTTFTHIDAKGKGTTLRSDGIINSKQTFKTKDGTVDGEIDEASKKTNYRLSAYYDDWFQHHGENRVNKAMQESMFSAEEVKDAHYRIFSTSNASAEMNMYEFEVYHP